jgi:hypothetical protein
MLQKLEIIFPQFIKKKRTQKMFSKVITTNQKDMQDYKKKSDNRFVEMKFIPDNINITKIIYSNKVAYLTFDEKNSYAILIKDQRITNNEKNAFDLVWNLL